MSARGGVLITRSKGDAGDYARLIEDCGYEVIFSPMLAVEALDTALPDLSDYSSLVFTSGHAVDIFARLSPERSKNVFTVGDVTAAKARDAGFGTVTSASGAADDLIALLHARGEKQALYLRGETIAHPLPDVDEHILYRAEAADDFSDLCEEKIRAHEIRAALFFSVRGAEIFAGLIRRKGLESYVSGIKALCLSAAVLESVSVLHGLESRAAATPDRAGMMALLAATLDR